MRFFALILAAAAAIAGWTFLWFSSSSALQDDIAAWVGARRASGYEVAYESLDIGGFPFRVKVTATKPSISWPKGAHPWRFDGERLVVVAPLWGRSHREARHEGFFTLRYARTGEAGARGDLVLKGAAKEARADVQFAKDGLERLSVDLSELSLQAAGAAKPLTANRLRFEARRGASSHEARGSGLEQPILGEFALSIDAMKVVGASGDPLGDTLDHGEARLSVRGETAMGGSEAELAAWRDAGGTVEIKTLAIEWGALDVEIEGALALDSNNRLLGALTARIADHARLIAALSGKPGPSPLASALDELAKEGGDAKGRLVVPLSFQDGEAFLGPFPVAAFGPVTSF